MSSCEEEDHDSDLLGPIHQKLSHSPEPSCVSMKSDMSMDSPLRFREEVPADQRPIKHKRSHPQEPSCVSIKSDQSMDPPLRFGEEVPAGQRPIKHKRSHPQEPSCVSMKSGQSMDPPCTFGEGAPAGQRYQQIHKSHMQNKFQCLIEGIPQQGDGKLLHEIYTELYITEVGRGEVNDEHEVRQIERASWGEAAQGIPVNCSDLMKPLSGQGKPIRTVLTMGVAGIGKTVSVQKFILDWAEGKANQDIHFIFPLPFRELNLIKKEVSLVDLFKTFFPEIKDPRVFTSSEHRVMFIFDGMDEYRLRLDFQTNLSCCDVTEQASVDVLLTNLIKGNLLPSALLWITTRPAAANQIPPECVSQVTEIRGFNDTQKEEYFCKRISDKNLANRTITHLKSSRSLYIMCHIPVFCWISAIVAESTSKESEKVQMPRTLTQMYAHFLIIQTSIKKCKYTEREQTDEEVIFKLGKLASQQLDKHNLIFYEEDLRECGIDITEASVYSGVCTQIFREESGLFQEKVFSFVHLSIQEFLAALYVFHLFLLNRQRNQQQTLQDVHKTAVDLAIKSYNGHKDIFLRFFLGLSLESNQTLLRPLLPQSSSQSESSEQTVQYVKQKIRDRGCRDVRDINLFFCLNELNHHAVVDVVYSEDLIVCMLSPEEGGIKEFIFKMSEEQLAGFDLQKYIKTPEEDQTELLSPDELIQRLVPVVKTSTSVRFEDCSLTDKSCSYLASALTSLSSSVRELSLGRNELGDSGVELLCSGLCHQNCKLEVLKLHNCNLTVKSGSCLGSALTSSSLRVLQLNQNELMDSGVEFLCSGLRHQNCKLEQLKLENCNLTEKSCSYLASVLTSHYSSLRVLELQQNSKLGDTGVELLCSGLSHQNCKLEELRLYKCGLTEKSCSYLAPVLASRSSSLRVLELQQNSKLGDSGVEHLCSGLRHENCTLEELVLIKCNLTVKSCSYLASALTSNPSSLRVLELQANNLSDSDIEQLSALQRDPRYKLETLLCGPTWGLQGSC